MRFGIVGFGKFAEKAILPGIRSSGIADVTAIQKRSLTAAQQKASEHSIPHAFDSVHDLVRHEDVDAVFIVSANSEHSKETIAAAKAGKHVLVEKPMAATVAQAEKMVRACRENGVTLMVGNMVRLSPVITRIKDLIAGGYVGSVAHISTEFFYDHRLSHRSWLFDKKVAGGGPVHDIGVHCLDTIRFILNDDIAALGSVVSPQPTATATERTSSTSLLFKGGTTASIFCSFEAPYRRSFIEVRGSDGTLSAFDFTKGGILVHLHKVHGMHGEPQLPQVEEIEVPSLYAEEVRQFVDAVQNGTEPPVTGEEGLINQKLLDAMLNGKL
jgi:1,5-anhydro-D-fructose reductase (1,5-anhydro-D-mannitol-forming)